MQVTPCLMMPSMVRPRTWPSPFQLTTASSTILVMSVWARLSTRALSSRCESTTIWVISSLMSRASWRIPSIHSLGPFSHSSMSASARMRVSGVFSSWLALLMKRFWRSKDSSMGLVACCMILNIKKSDTSENRPAAAMSMTNRSRSLSRKSLPSTKSTLRPSSCSSHTLKR